MSEAVQTTFDYALIEPETRIVVQQRTSEIKSLMRRAAQDIIDIGEKLTDVKTRLRHGEFGPWLALEFQWTDQTARNFMNVAGAFKSKMILDLPVTQQALYVLAAPSTPEAARKEAFERAEAGEAISYSEARAIVAGHRERQIESIGPGVKVRPAPNLDIGDAIGDPEIVADFGVAPEGQIEAQERVLDTLIACTRSLQALADSPPELGHWPPPLQVAAIRSGVSQIVDLAYSIAETYNAALDDTKGIRMVK